ncbi:putative sodium symporter protein [Haloterrigena turkmenica DSM 5511]|uniref:Sodium symporter protein n=1 Tax=Haloterrigena turkmenica (strain ATCC 51198 / DSM 5511 / JCM 9101 / NCIMB 13204 / VKM B-1734 / 4k) TaxID=543526 RepID=D2RYG7_HALTV|nr:cation acetate symporter [Haloterrigena turkmenica]ADB59868.1 putative sodium symporter protein [Haloterrigena turkmenica DSM 5511]
MTFPLQADALDISFKLVPAIMVFLMMASFLAIGYVFKVADTDGMWVAGRGIGNIENGMAIGANWMSAASYLGLAGLVALSGFYGLAFIVGWTTGYFVLLIFLAAQMRRFGKYTAPDFVGDRFNSPAARALAAFTTLLIAYVYSVGQARGMGLVGQYVFGLDIIPMIIVMMTITVGYLALSGMLGATKNMAVQYVILIVAFLAGVYAVGWTQGYSTALPPLEYGALFDELSRQFSEPFLGDNTFYLWVATAFSLIVGTCGLPHVLVRFYTVQNERTARWSTVWGLFFICLLYWAAPAMAAFGVDLYSQVNSIAPEAVFSGDQAMSGAEGDVIVVLAAQFADLPTWFVGLVAAGAMAAAIATTAGLFITASSAVAHDIYTELINPDATQREQVLIGRATIVVIGALVTVTAFNPPALIGELVAYAFSLAGIVLFPMFFLGLWWENTNKPGALAGMSVGLFIWITSIINSVLPSYIGFLAETAGGEGAALVPIYAQYVPPIGAALVGTPAVFIVTIVVSMVTDEPPMETKRLVRQCHSPEPMGQQQTAQDVVGTDGGETPADD